MRPGTLYRRQLPAGNRAAENGEHEETDYRLKGVLPMADNKQHDTRTARRPDCVTEIRMGNSVLVVSGYFKKDRVEALYFGTPWGIGVWLSEKTGNCGSICFELCR